MEGLPRDVVGELVRHLTVSDLIEMARTSWRLWERMQDNRIWRTLLTSKEMLDLLHSPTREYPPPHIHDSDLGHDYAESFPLALRLTIESKKIFELNRSILMIFFFVWYAYPHVWIKKNGRVARFQSTTLLEHEDAGKILQDPRRFIASLKPPTKVRLKATEEPPRPLERLRVPYVWIYADIDGKLSVAGIDKAVPPFDLRQFLQKNNGSMPYRYWRFDGHRLSLINARETRGSNIVSTHFFEDSREALFGPAVIPGGMQKPVQMRWTRSMPRAFHVLLTHHGADDFYGGCAVFVYSPVLGEYVPLVVTHDNTGVYVHREHPGQRLQCEICGEDPHYKSVDEKHLYCEGCVPADAVITE